MQQPNNHPFRIISEAEIKDVNGGANTVPVPRFTFVKGEDGGPINTTMATGEEGGIDLDIFR